MTREQAKREIDSLDFYLQNHTDDYGEESHTAMMMAIKALEQEPCEDCISREDALMALTGEWTEPTDELIHRFIRRIKNLPSVNPAKKQELCEDAVSRQAVEDAIENTIVNGEELGYAVAYDILSDLPSVNPQPKTGHWIPLGNYDDFGNESSYKCSECGDIDTYPDNFCPDCGAKMVEPQESEVKE